MLLLVALIVGSVNGAWADDTESVTFSNVYEDKEKPTGYDGTDFSIAFAKGSSSNDAQYYSSGTGVRVYCGATMTISSTTKKIAGISFTYKMNNSSKTYPTGVSASVGTANIPVESSSTSGTWVAADNNTSSVTFTTNGTKGNIQYQAITVTFVETASTSPLASIALSGTYPTSFTVGDMFSNDGMVVTANYENGDKKTVTSKVILSGYDMSATGNQTVTVSYTENEVTKTATYNIEVKSAAGLIFTPTSQTVAIGGKETISFSKATDADVTFVVADETIATYDPATGEVSGKKEGTTTITATSAENSNYSAGEAICTITVIDPNWIDFTTKPYNNAEDVKTETGSNGSVTLALGSNDHGNNPKWYDSGSAVRLYTGNTITITAKTGYVLTDIEFNVTSGSMSAEGFSQKVTNVGNKFTLVKPENEIVYTTASNFRVDKIKLSIAEPIAVTSAGYATYVSDNDLDYSGLAVKAYKALVSEKAISFTKVTTVPAGEGVMLQGAEGTYNVPVAASAVAAWADIDNAFVRGSDAPVASDNGDGKYNYVLSTDDKGVVGFYKANGNTVARNRAYLQSTTNAARLAFNFDDETGEATGISEMKNAKADAAIYNLNGVRVKNMTKGLYIMNGKKVIVK